MTLYEFLLFIHVTASIVWIGAGFLSLVLAFSTRLWAAWFCLLLALVWTYKPYLIEGVVIVYCPSTELNWNSGM